MSVPRLALLFALIFSGCSLVGDDAAEIGFGVEVPAALSAEVTLRGRSVALGGGEPTPRGVWRGAELFETSPGSAAVACSVSSGAASTTGTLDLDLEADWQYSVFCTTSAANPTDVCFGCRGSTSVALDPGLGQPADHRLWLVWGGGPTDSSVIY